MSAVNKAALRDPASWVGALDGASDDTEPGAEARRRAEALVPLARELRELERARGRTSRRIGEAKERSADASELISAMREIGARSRAIENALREELETIAATLRPPATGSGGGGEVPDGAMPEYFRPVRRTRAPEPDTVPTLAVSEVEGAGEDYTRYVRAHPARTRYHELGLRELIADTLGQRSHHLIARDERGAVRGVLPLVRLESPLFGHFVVSMPWFNYGGPLADDERVSETLMAAAAALAREHGCSHAEIRETRPRDGWTSRTHKVSMTLALPGSVAAFEGALGSKLRSQSSKAERAGCTFRSGGAELLDDFHRVFSVNMRDLGTPAHGRAFFEGLLERFGDGAFLAVVRRGSTPLAAGFLLDHGTTLEIPWASSLRRSSSLDVNMYLYRRTLQEAIARGYRHFDFGRSTPGGNTWRFKKQWGAVPRQLHWHYWTREGGEAPGGLSPDNPKYRLAIATWQRMPVALTRLIGPSIVRGLP